MNGEVSKSAAVVPEVKGGPNPEDEEEFEQESRGAWGSSMEFILTCVGYAVGLGNVWRFPYLCFKNGGGAFLLPYVLMLIMCGLPLYCLELCFGQFASLGPLSIWTISPVFKGIGMGMVAIYIMVGLSYNILLSYIIFFFFASMSGSELPWANCDNDWNSNYSCLTTEQVQNKSFLADYLDKYNMTNEEIRTPSEEYFYNEVLQMSGGVDEAGGVVWQLALCLALAWLIVFLVLIRGIKSLGKNLGGAAIATATRRQALLHGTLLPYMGATPWMTMVVYFTSIFPYIMMTVMVVRGATLPGAIEGIKFYLKPDFDRLAKAEVWSDAASQIFYSLGTGAGGLIAMASYNRFDNNVIRDAVLVPIINCATSLFAGFAIFSVLGFMAVSKGVDVEDVAASGPGLVFVVYPEGLSQMPVSVLWSILFFFMMVTLGFSSQFSIVESVFVSVMDQFPILRATSWRPTLFRAVCILLYFLLCLPMITNGGFYMFSLVDEYAGGFPRLFLGFFEIIAISWIYGMSRFSEDIYMMLGRRPNIYFRACWIVLSPLVIFGIAMFKIIEFKPLTLFNGAYVFPSWGDTLGWLMFCGVVAWIPLYAVGYWVYTGGWEVMKRSAAPLPEWGPTLAKNRTGRYATHNQEMQVFRLQQTKSPNEYGLHSSIKPYTEHNSVYDNAAFTRT